MELTLGNKYYFIHQSLGHAQKQTRTLILTQYLCAVLESELDPRNVRLTTQSEPKILMEVMPAALVVSLLVLTYLVFAGGVVLIVRHNLRGTSTLGVAGTGAGYLCTDTATNTSSSSSATSSRGGVYVVGIDGPDPDSPSAAGCTVFSPTLSGLSFDAAPLSSSSSSLADDDGDSGSSSAGRYGAVFSGQFSGMTDLSGSVSLHVSLADEEVLASLPDPATVDLALEACTGGATAVEGAEEEEEGEEEGVVELEWGTCSEGWQPVLFQVLW